MSEIQKSIRTFAIRARGILGLAPGLFLALLATVLSLPELLEDASRAPFRRNQRAVLHPSRMHHAVVGIVVFLVVATVLAVAGIEIVQNADIGTSVGAGIVSGGLIFVAICVALLFYYVGKRAARHQL
jgi:uncharacterized BrkB/YihY/UPF0761 family membrane protein